jgi:hypothetical protein
VFDLSFRLYNCNLCQALTLVCNVCDRGQCYCSTACAKTARTRSLQRAGATYRRTWQGKVNGAVRQQRYRDHQRQHVTHQGSQSLPLPPTVEITIVETTVALIIPEDDQGVEDQQTDTVTLPQPENPGFAVACRFCCRTGSPRLRRGTLRHAVHKRPTHRPP